MKRNTWYTAVMILCVMVFTLVAVNHVGATTIMDNRPYHHAAWENRHADVVNAQLVTSNVQILANSECYVNMAREYALRDPLLSVYGKEMTMNSSNVQMDAFLLGLKANNLTYLIHAADTNPNARYWAIRDLRMLSQTLATPTTRRHFECWINALENRMTPSTRLSHVYVHYTPDFGEVIASRMGQDARRYYFTGYLINDFMVSSVVGRPQWIAVNQEIITNVNSVYTLRALERHQAESLRRFARMNLNGPGAVQEAVETLDVVRRAAINYGDERVFTPFRSVY
jgi:hypothetical protein